MERENNCQCLGCSITIRQILFIVAITITEIGCNFCMDIPASLEVSMTSHYDLSSSQFSLLYSLYYLPAIFMNTLSGYLIDRWLGIKWTTLLFNGIAVFGISIFATGGVIDIFWVMLLGRLIFGLGNEIATGVCVNYCVFSWYNHMMNFVASLNTNFSFLGTLAIFQTSPRLLNYLNSVTHLSYRDNLGLVIVITSLVLLPTAITCVWMTFLGPREGKDNDNNDSGQTSVTTVIETPVKVSDVHKFPLLFWSVCAFMGLQTSTASFIQYSQGLFTEDLGLTIQDASNAMTVLNLTKIILSVPFSIVVDKIGRNVIFIAVSAVLLLVPHLLIILHCTPFVAMFILGVSQSLFGSAVMPMFGLTVNDKSLIGSCYGIASSVNGLCMFITPFIMGFLIDRYGFKTGQLLYVIAASADIGVVILIWMLDRNSTGVLNMSPQERDNLSRRLQDVQGSGPPESLASLSSMASSAHLISYK